MFRSSKKNCGICTTSTKAAPTPKAAPTQSNPTPKQLQHQSSSTPKASNQNKEVYILNKYVEVKIQQQMEEKYQVFQIPLTRLVETKQKKVYIVKHILDQQNYVLNRYGNDDVYILY